MKTETYKTFDLRKGHPQVLLFGNGLFHDECDWGKFIQTCGVDKNITLPDNIPYSIMADIVIEDANDKNKFEKYSNTLSKIGKSKKPLINELLKIKFDAILTTNYTYQLENAIDSEYGNASSERKRKKYARLAREKKTNAKYLINTYNCMRNGDIEQDIWHIHGEARRPSSIVLTHDEYGRLIQKMLEEIKEIGNKYENFYDSASFKSWIDYLLMGDVYILGLGMDFHEFDLWWMLTRRVRERAKTGKIIFYEPFSERQNSKFIALKNLGVECKHLDTDVTDGENNSEKYTEFYDMAVRGIERCVNTAREESE